jgi:hypothetical protein
MRVYDRKPLTSSKIRIDHILHKRRFSHAGLSDEVHMRPSVFALDAKPGSLIAKISFSKDGDVIFIRNAACHK